MDTVVSRGDSFNLTCVAMGIPTPDIIWMRGGVLVGHGHVVGNYLVFEEALPDHAGTYTCIATSGEDSVTASATVTVNCESEDVMQLCCICSEQWLYYIQCIVCYCQLEVRLHAFQDQRDYNLRAHIRGSLMCFDTPLVVSSIAAE